MNEEQQRRWGCEHIYEVVPDNRYIYWESASLPRSPVTHIIHPNEAHQTLCKRDPNTWQRSDMLLATEMPIDERPQAICQACWRELQRRIN